MKKLLTLVFVFATVLVSTNVLTSCKDYDEDYKNDLARLIDTEHIDIWSAIKTNYSILRVAADSLYDLQEACSLKCKETRDSLDARYSRLVYEDGKLQTAINNLNTAVAGKADTATVNALQGIVDILRDSVQILQGEIDGLTARVTALEVQDSLFAIDLQKLHDADSLINLQLVALRHDSDSARHDIDSIFDMLKNLKPGSDGSVNVDSLTKILANTFNITNTTINDIKGDLGQLVSDTLGDYYLKSEVDSIFNNYYDQTTINQKLGDYYTKTQVNNLLKVINDSLITLDSKILEVKGTADDALRLAKLDSIWIEALKTNVAKNDSAINARVDSLANVVANLNIPDAYNDSQVIINKDSIYINAKAIDALRTDLNNYIAKNDARVDSLAQVTDELADLIEQAEKNRKDADELLQKQINAIVLALADVTEKNNEQDAAIESLSDLLNTKIAELEEAYKAADEELQGEIDDLEKRVKANEEAIEKLDEKIDKVKEELTDRLDKVDEALKKLITGIIPQAVVNPVYGTFAAPIGISSKVLIAFYGQNSTPVVFPTNATANYVKNSQLFTDEDWSMINGSLESVYVKQGNSTLIDDAEDNAGTLYLTVNPGEVDFDGQQLTLVNSKDEESKITLAPLQKENDYLIKFGYTRAADDNGFYSAKAHLDAADINAVKVNINTELKSTFKELLQQRTMSKVGELALNVYDQFNGILPAQAVKAEWTIQDSKGNDIKRSFRSDYGLAATAIQPLSYAFLEDLNVKTVPGYEQAVRLVNRAAKEVKEAVNVTVGGALVTDIQNLNIKKIELAELSNDLKAKFIFHMDTTVVISGLQYHLELNQPVQIKFTQNATVDLSGVEAEVTVPTMVVNAATDGSLQSAIIVPIKDKDGEVVKVKDVEGHETALTATIQPEQVNLNITTTASTPETKATAIIANGTTVVATVPVDQTVYVDIDKIIELDDYSFKFHKDVDMTDAIDELWGEVGNQLDNVNDMLAQLEKIVDDANDLLDDQNGFFAKISLKVDNAASRIQSYIDRINNKLASVINSANQRIQPVLLLTANNTGTKRLSRAQGQPTVLKDANVTFIPTSYTADIVTPAFKKHIAAVDVIKGTKSAQGGDAACKTALEKFNKQNDINKVLPGTQNAVDASFQAGYVYVIAYSALDYHGKISMHKYYVRY